MEKIKLTPPVITAKYVIMHKFVSSMITQHIYCRDKKEMKKQLKRVHKKLYPDNNGQVAVFKLDRRNFNKKGNI